MLKTAMKTVLYVAGDENIILPSLVFLKALESTMNNFHCILLQKRIKYRRNIKYSLATTQLKLLTLETRISTIPNILKNLAGWEGGQDMFFTIG